MIKESVYAQTALQTLQKEEGLEGVQLAMDLNVSPQLISNIKHGHRKLQKDIAKASLTTYDSPMYAMELLYEFSEGYTAPVLKAILANEYGISLKKCIKERKPYWKSKGWI